VACTVEFNKEVRLLHAAMVNNQFWYRAVLKHVRECEKCDPEKILREYFEKRNATKKETSIGFVQLAVKYRKLAIERKKPLPDTLFKEILMSADATTPLVYGYEKYLTYSEIMSMISREHEAMNYTQEIFLSRKDPNSKTIPLCRVLRDYGKCAAKFDEEKLVALCKMYEVHSS